VDVIEEIVSDEEAISANPNKSAPKWVLDRAVKYIEKEGLSEEDDLWFVMDVDRWSDDQLRNIAEYCDQHPNWHIVLSNPCFEVWLYFHRKPSTITSASVSCNQFKAELATMERGGYHPLKFIPQLSEAIAHAKAADNDKLHFMPDPKTSKVYQLGEAIIKVLGKNGFDDFLNTTLPKLIQLETKTKSNSKLKQRGK
jgi:hypothetical protein